MAEYEPKPGDGALFKNKNKKTDKHPDYTGNWRNANGEKCNVAAWHKTSANGMNYMSLNIETEPYNQEPQQESPPDDVDDDVFF